jgi:L-malate glycosyltransferase
MAAGALHILADENLPRFRAAALARANEFALDAIVPDYEACYVRATETALARKC